MSNRKPEEIYEDGFKYGKWHAEHFWAKAYRLLRKFNFAYDTRYKKEVNELLALMDKEADEILGKEQNK